MCHTLCSLPHVIHFCFGSDSDELGAQPSADADTECNVDNLEPVPRKDAAEMGAHRPRTPTARAGGRHKPRPPQTPAPPKPPPPETTPPIH